MPGRDERTIQDMERVSRLEVLISSGDLTEDEFEIAERVLDKNPSIGDVIERKATIGGIDPRFEGIAYQCFTSFDRERVDTILAAHGRGL